MTSSAPASSTHNIANNVRAFDRDVIAHSGIGQPVRSFELTIELELPGPDQTRLDAAADIPVCDPSRWPHRRSRPAGAGDQERRDIRRTNDRCILSAVRRFSLSTSAYPPIRAGGSSSRSRPQRRAPVRHRGAQACGSPIVRSVTPLTRHHRTGIGSTMAKPPRASSRKPSVAIAVGSGAMPKTSARPSRVRQRCQQRLPGECEAEEEISVQPQARVGRRRDLAQRHARRATAFNSEGRRDIGGSPVDGRIAIPQERPADEDPGIARMNAIQRAAASRPPRDEQDDDEAGAEHQQMQRP